MDTTCNHSAALSWLWLCCAVVQLQSRLQSRENIIRSRRYGRVVKDTVRRYSAYNMRTVSHSPTWDVVLVMPSKSATALHGLATRSRSWCD